MNIDMLKEFFMWCSIINFGLLMFSVIIVTAARDWVYKIHSRMFAISREQLDLALYLFLGFYKLLVFVFCIIPWIALCIIW